MPGKNFNEIKSFTEKLKLVLSLSAKRICVKCLRPGKTFLQPTGTGFRVGEIMMFCLITSYANGEACKLNNYASTRRKTILVDKGDLIQ
jgi:hypothetical protein